MWVLVYITLLFPDRGYYDIDVQMLGQYDDVIACFVDRDAFLIEQGQYDGFPKPNTQLVCIRTEDFTD